MEDVRVVPGPGTRLLGTGEFARRSRLSVKALRLYERQGLLRPASVDPATGYRRYREDQLAPARLVALLRRLDMPLALVGTIVAAPEDRRSDLVARYWDGVEHRMAVQRALAAHLRVVLAGGEGLSDMYEIRQRDVAAQVVLTEQRHLRQPELVEWIGAAMVRAERAAAPFGGAAGAPYVVYHGEVNEDSDGPVELCFPIEPGGAEVTAAHRVEEAHREAYARLPKAHVVFPQILSAFDAVAAWLEENGHAVAGAPREVYFTDFAAAGPGDEVCDVAFPMR
ncbi:MerR family transcriptional regulator [Saccharothrix yanglingensis]|uniref:MerR family transcriptional regulator n=1 Tax=Saccharothrix yanglingensis TaxID=659496 RepID=A0ABU0X4B3_9PSEU|nr:MerR family transcriptional regulator [Saccharothrix yanglingensis]MDQ2586976.1 MerR family transcriptional regulator [Saccharothrix yanglingensis]